MSQKEQYLEIDQSAIKKQIVISGVFLLLICIVTTVLFRSLFNYTNRIEQITLLVLWVSMTLIWGLGSILIWYKWQKNKYILTDDSLIVIKSDLTGSTESYYRYDSFLSIEVKQGILNKKTGTIIINIPKMDQPLILENINNPNKEAERLKRRISKTSKDTKSLIN